MEMKLLIDLFSTDYGLMSIAVVMFIIGMGIFFIRYFLSHMREEEQQKISCAANSWLG
jgi:uncharacterized membrane-anchored protein